MSDFETTQIEELVSHCKNCGQCSLSCPTHYVGLFNPLGVLRDLQMSGPNEAIKNQPLYHCLTCNRCMTNCPNSKDGEGMDFAKLMRLLREYAKKNNIEIKNRAEFPGVSTIVHTDALEGKTEVLDKIPEIEVQKFFFPKSRYNITKEGPIAYVIGDLPFYQKQSPEIADEFTQIAHSVVKILNQVGVTPAVLNLKPIGHDDFWAGSTDIFSQLAKENTQRLLNAGVSTIIVESAEAYRTLKFDYPEVVNNFNFQVLHLSEFLLNNDLVRKLKIDHGMEVSYTFSDSSRLGRMGGKLYEPPRQILSKIGGITLKELESNRDDAYECGVEIFLPDGKEFLQMWDMRIKELLDVQADYFLTTSPKTLLNFSIHTSTEQYEDVKIPIIKDWAVFLSRLLN